MDRYVEVVGQADLHERAVEYRAQLTISARANVLGTALGEASLLRDETVRLLRQHGMKADELTDGGRHAWTPWYQPRHPQGQTCSYLILLRCAEAHRMYAAMDGLEPLFARPTHTLAVSMREPRFEADESAWEHAQASAIVDARGQARRLCAAAFSPLGKVLQITQLRAESEGSGAYGDHGIAVLSDRGPAGPEPLDAAERIRTLHYRVRFALD